MTDISYVDVLEVARRTADAHSAHYWGAVGWVRATEMLFRMGLTEEEVEGVLRSKHTRWARDEAYEESVDAYLFTLHGMVAQMEKKDIQELIV